MKSFGLFAVLLGSLTLSGAALAQDEGGTTPPPTPAPAAPAAASGFSVGIGAGWTLPTDITVPNTVSARFGIMPRLVIEPIVVLSYDSQANTTTFAGTSTEDDVSTLNFDITALGRYALATRGPITLAGLAGLTFGYDRTKDDPAGADNVTVTSTFGFGIGWGLGLDYQIRPWWSLTFDATNPLLAYTSTKNDPPGDGYQTTSDFLFGAIWHPTIRLMTHLYF